MALFDDDVGIGDGFSLTSKSYLRLDVKIWRLQDDDVGIEDGFSLTSYSCTRLDATYEDFRTTTLVLR